MKAIPAQEALARAVTVRLAQTGTTQANLAAQIGVSPSTLSQWLNSTRSLSLTRVEDIARALGHKDVFSLFTYMKNVQADEKEGHHA